MICLFADASKEVAAIVNLTLTAGGLVIAAVINEQSIDYIELETITGEIIIANYEPDSDKYFIYLNDDLVHGNDIKRLFNYLSKEVDRQIQ